MISRCPPACCTCSSWKPNDISVFFSDSTSLDKRLQGGGVHSAGPSVCAVGFERYLPSDLQPLALNMEVGFSTCRACSPDFSSTVAGSHWMSLGCWTSRRSRRRTSAKRASDSDGDGDWVARPMLLTWPRSVNVAIRAVGWHAAAVSVWALKSARKPNGLNQELPNR